MFFLCFFKFQGRPWNPLEGLGLMFFRKEGRPQKRFGEGFWEKRKWGWLIFVICQEIRIIGGEINGYFYERSSPNSSGRRPRSSADTASKSSSRDAHASRSTGPSRSERSVWAARESRRSCFRDPGSSEHSVWWGQFSRPSGRIYLSDDGGKEASDRCDSSTLHWAG